MSTLTDLENDPNRGSLQWAQQVLTYLESTLLGCGLRTPMYLDALRTFDRTLEAQDQRLERARSGFRHRTQQVDSARLEIERISGEDFPDPPGTQEMVRRIRQLVADHNNARISLMATLANDLADARRLLLLHRDPDTSVGRESLRRFNEMAEQNGWHHAVPTPATRNNLRDDPLGLGCLQCGNVGVVPVGHTEDGIDYTMRPCPRCRPPLAADARLAVCAICEGSLVVHRHMGDGVVQEEPCICTRAPTARPVPSGRRIHLSNATPTNSTEAPA